MGYTIQASKRGKGRASKLRLTGMVPGVIYGPERTSTSVSVSARELEKLYEQAGQSSLIDFILDGEEAVLVLIQDLQFHPIKGTIIHIDFLQSKADATLDVNIALNFVGESPAVKQGGTLTVVIDEVEATCLPKDLISSFDVDISVLKTFEDHLTIKDLQFSKDIEIHDDKDALVVRVAPPLSEADLKHREDATKASTPTKVPVVEGEKKEEAPAEEKK